MFPGWLTDGRGYRGRVNRPAGPIAKAAIVAAIVIELIITVSLTWISVVSSGRVIRPDDVPPGSTLLVLGSLVADGRPGDYVRGRLDTAVDVFLSGRAARIIDSGNGSADAGDEPAVMRSYLLARGVPGSRIVDDGLGLDTAASCRRAREVFGATMLVVVTQDFHLRRAIALCRDAGVDARGVPAHCSCPVTGQIRNHLRETVLAGPRALWTMMW